MIGIIELERANVMRVRTPQGSVESILRLNNGKDGGRKKESLHAFTYES